MITDKVLKEIKESTGHSAFGPSSMPRIVLCPGSVNESLKAPPKESSVYAREGTLLHAAIEELLLEKYKNIPPKDHYYDKLNIVQAAWVLDALEYADKIISMHTDPTIIIEGDVDLSSWGVAECTGTADLVVISEKRADICDWKFGSGVPRYAYYKDTGKGDYQSLCYAAGALGFDNEHPNIDVGIHVCQPPLKIQDHWEINYTTIINEIMVVQEAVLKARSANPPLNPGLSQCRFCGANMICETRHNAVKHDAARVFNAMSATVVSDEAISKLLSKAVEIEQYIKDAQKYVMAQIMSGHGDRFPDFKLVSGRSNRKWKMDETNTACALMDKGLKPEHVYAQSLVSPAQADTAFKKMKQEAKKQGIKLEIPDISDLWGKGEGKPQLAPISDGRPALKLDATQVFDVEHTETEEIE